MYSFLRIRITSILAILLIAALLLPLSACGRDESDNYDQGITDSQTDLSEDNTPMDSDTTDQESPSEVYKAPDDALLIELSKNDIDIILELANYPVYGEFENRSIELILFMTCFLAGIRRGYISNVDVSGIKEFLVVTYAYREEDAVLYAKKLYDYDVDLKALPDGDYTGIIRAGGFIGLKSMGIETPDTFTEIKTYDLGDGYILFVSDSAYRMSPNQPPYPCGKSVITFRKSSESPLGWQMVTCNIYN